MFLNVTAWLLPLYIPVSILCIRWRCTQLSSKFDCFGSTVLLYIFPNLFFHRSGSSRSEINASAGKAHNTVPKLFCKCYCTDSSEGTYSVIFLFCGLDFWVSCHNLFYELCCKPSSNRSFFRRNIFIWFHVIIPIMGLWSEPDASDQPPVILSIQVRDLRHDTRVLATGDSQHYYTE